MSEPSGPGVSMEGLTPIAVQSRRASSRRASFLDSQTARLRPWARLSAMMAAICRPLPQPVPSPRKKPLRKRTAPGSSSFTISTWCGASPSRQAPGNTWAWASPA